jgi:primosomal protein N' (replication factor Y)
MYAEIAVNVPVRTTFHYHIPAQLAGKLKPGHLVRVSFGTADQPGIVLSISQSSPITQTKPVKELLDSTPALGIVHIQVARWLSETTLAPLGACLWMFLPPGIAGSSDIQISLTEAGKWIAENPPEALDNLSEHAQFLLRLLARRGALRGRQLNQAMRGKGWQAASEALVRHELARREVVLSPPSVQPRRIRTARLAIPAEHIDAIAPRLGKESQQASVLEVMLASRETHPTVASICVAAGCTDNIIKTLVKSGDLALIPRSRWLELTMPTSQLAEQLATGAFDRAKKQKEALEALVAAKGALPIEEVSAGITNALVKRGLVTSGEQPATVSLASRYLQPDGTPDHEAVLARLIELRGGGKALSVLHLLAREEQAVQVNWIYAQTDSDLKLLRELAEEGLILLGEEDHWRDPLAERSYSPTVAPVFTSDQHDVWERLRQHLDKLKWEGISPTPDEPHVFLLHGVTGSGKTEVYLRAVEHTLAHGRGAIVLVPEIALTPQTVSRFAARFPGQVAVIHGDLSQGERFDAWRRARNGELSVIVGTRSALFTPLPDLGLVILDEEHDTSYKQSPPLPPPYYHAREAAIELTRRSRGVVILGSATPSIESMHAARRQLYQRIVLPVRVAGHRGHTLEVGEGGNGAALYHPGDPMNAITVELPEVDVVDMRAELKTGNTSMFSRVMQKALAEVLERQEQAILFLNRRGTASYVFCRDCGYVANCPRCDMPMTYHEAADTLRCHHCGYRLRSPVQCPTCQSRRIKHFGAGTEAIQTALGELLPSARSIRWDRDTASHHREHDAILSRFAARDASILIGTQMIAKGLDLPGVTLVGVLNADVGLALPDFRARERAFQLLTQVVGRAGRGSQPGRGIIQTYRPDDRAIQAASRHDYGTFYKGEIAERRELGYPPFRRLARLLIRHRSAPQAQQEAEQAAGILRRRIHSLGLDGTSIIGPAPCFFGKLEGYYRWHIIVRSPDPVLIFNGMELARGWHLDIDALDVL